VIPHDVFCSLSVFQILTIYSSNLLRLCWKPCGDEDESIDHKIHLVESSINTHLIQTIFFLYLLWVCDATVLVFFHWIYIYIYIYIYALARALFLVYFSEKTSENIDRSPFIKLSVYFIRFVIIKPFIKKIFGSTHSSILCLVDLKAINENHIDG